MKLIFIISFMNTWGWVNKILSRADYINLLSSLKWSHCMPLNHQIQRLLLEKVMNSLFHFSSRVLGDQRKQPTHHFWQILEPWIFKVQVTETFLFHACSLQFCSQKLNHSMQILLGRIWNVINHIFLDCHMSLNWTVALTIIMQLTDVL